MECDSFAHVTQVASSRACAVPSPPYNAHSASRSADYSVGGSADHGATAANPFESAGDSAITYVDSRPSYASEALEWALHSVPAGARVADIGAGTGRLTDALVRRGYDVWALEPAADMRSEFLRYLPNFPATRLLGTTAEATGLGDHLFDVLTYGESWHWLDASLAAREAARLLRPGGILVLVYNQLAVEHPWVHRLTRIMRSGDVQRPDRPPALGDLFSTPEFFAVDWADRVTPEQIIELGTTRASWIRATPALRTRMRGNLVHYLYTELGMQVGESLALPYHTYVWRAQPAADSIARLYR